MDWYDYDFGDPDRDLLEQMDYEDERDLTGDVCPLEFDPELL